MRLGEGEEEEVKKERKCFQMEEYALCLLTYEMTDVSLWDLAISRHLNGSKIVETTT